MMAKIKKVRVSATVRPDQKKYLEKWAGDLDMSIAEALIEALDIARAAREAQKVGA